MHSTCAVLCVQADATDAAVDCSTSCRCSQFTNAVPHGTAVCFESNGEGVQPARLLPMYEMQTIVDDDPGVCQSGCHMPR